jgi:uncharacterized membrane protein
LLFIALLALLLTLVQIGVLTIAFDKLGVSRESAFGLLLGSLLGSAVNLPLFVVRGERAPTRWQRFDLLGRWPASGGRTLIAVNVGGCVVPVGFSLHLMLHTPLALEQVAVATAMVAIISYMTSRPIAEVGIGMPPLVAPFSAALIASAIAPDHSAPLAYICGTLGVLIGADLFRLKDIAKLGGATAAIGGAGTFDGIFMTGIVAVLLA